VAEGASLLALGAVFFGTFFLLDVDLARPASREEQLAYTQYVDLGHTEYLRDSLECDTPYGGGGQKARPRALHGAPEVPSRSVRAATPEEVIERQFRPGDPLVIYGRSALGPDTKGRKRYLFTYDREGKRKVAVVVARVETSPDVWEWDKLVHCDLSEIPEAGLEKLARRTLWTTRTGALASTTRVYSFRMTPEMQRCYGHGVEVVSYGGGQYIADPLGTLPRPLKEPYVDDAVLPDDAVDTGLRRGEDALWHNRDAARIYLVGPVGVRALPRLTYRSSVFIPAPELFTSCASP
jgi:hypothetical protein